MSPADEQLIKRRGFSERRSAQWTCGALIEHVGQLLVKPADLSACKNTRDVFAVFRTFTDVAARTSRISARFGTLPKIPADPSFSEPAS